MQKKKCFEAFFILHGFHFFFLHLQLTEEGRKSSAISEEEEEEEGEDGNRESGKFTLHLIMNVTAGGVELRKLLFVLTFLVLAAFSNWIALAYIHDL